MLLLLFPLVEGLDVILLELDVLVFADDEVFSLSISGNCSGFPSFSTTCSPGTTISTSNNTKTRLQNKITKHNQVIPDTTF